MRQEATVLASSGGADIVDRPRATSAVKVRPIICAAPTVVVSNL